MKYFDTQKTQGPISQGTSWAAAAVPPNTGTPNTLLCPTVGSAINQRIGRKVQLHKLRIKGTLELPGIAGSALTIEPTKIRLVLVQDMQTNATQAAGNAIFADPLTANAIYTVDQFQSLENLGRFKVWKDKTFVLNTGNSYNVSTSTATVPPILRDFKINLVFKKPIEVSFNSVNGGTISDVVDHSFCLYVAAAPGGTNNDPTISFVARAYYKE